MEVNDDQVDTPEDQLIANPEPVAPASPVQYDNPVPWQSQPVIHAQQALSSSEKPLERTTPSSSNMQPAKHPQILSKTESDQFKHNSMNNARVNRTSSKNNKITEIAIQLSSSDDLN